MDVLKEDNFVRHEICDLKHKTLDTEVSEAKDSINEITHPSTGYIAVAIEALEKKIDKVDAKINGLIMFLSSTAAGAAVTIGVEFFIKK